MVVKINDLLKDVTPPASAAPTQPGAAGPTQNRKSGPKASDADARAIQTMLVEYKYLADSCTLQINTCSLQTTEPCENGSHFLLGRGYISC